MGKKAEGNSDIGPPLYHGRKAGKLMYSFDEIKNFDPELAQSIELEIGRQNDHIELIASENFVSKAVMAAMGSPMTNKYAEGYPGKRYYGGCQFVDIAENLAIARAKELFGSMPTYSLIRARRRIWRCFLHFYSRGIP